MAVYLKGCLKEAMKFQNASRLVPQIGQMAKKFLHYYYIFCLFYVHTIYNLESFFSLEAYPLINVVGRSFLIKRVSYQKKLSDNRQLDNFEGKSLTTTNVCTAGQILEKVLVE